jgi:L-ribulose-5-phosphate 4-epimerase
MLNIVMPAQAGIQDFGRRLDPGLRRDDGVYEAKAMSKTATAELGPYIAAMQRYAARAHQAGLQTGTGGNLSVRIPGSETMLIKASGGSFADLQAPDIVHADFSGRVLEGSAKPSRELQSHALLYRRCPDAGAIFHCHSPWAIACAARFDTVPLVTLHMEMKLGAIPVLSSDGHADGKMVDDLAAFLAAHAGLRAFIQRRHGIFSLAADIGAAEMQAELVEECAKIAVLECISRGVA